MGLLGCPKSIWTKSHERNYQKKKKKSHMKGQFHEGPYIIPLQSTTTYGNLYSSQVHVLNALR